VRLAAILRTNLKLFVNCQRSISMGCAHGTRRPAKLTLRGVGPCSCINVGTQCSRLTSPTKDEELACCQQCFGLKFQLKQRRYVTSVLLTCQMRSVDHKAKGTLTMRGPEPALPRAAEVSLLLRALSACLTPFTASPIANCSRSAL